MTLLRTNEAIDCLHRERTHACDRGRAAPAASELRARLNDLCATRDELCNSLDATRATRRGSVVQVTRKSDPGVSRPQAVHLTEGRRSSSMYSCSRKFSEVTTRKEAGRIARSDLRHSSVVVAQQRASPRVARRTPPRPVSH